MIEPGPKTVSCRSCDRAGSRPASRLEGSYSHRTTSRKLQNARGSVVAEPVRSIWLPLKKSLKIWTGGRHGAYRRGSPRNSASWKTNASSTKRWTKKPGKQKRKGQQAILRDSFEELSADGDVAIEDYWRKNLLPHGIEPA